MTTISPICSLDCPPRWATRRNPDRPTLGGRVAEVAALLGTPLMPWQRYVADVAMEIDPATGKLIYREVIVTVPRQSGKTTLLLAVMVHRALGFNQRQRIVYTAQTRNDARIKMEDEHVPVLERSKLRGLFEFRRANGSEALKWNNGSIHTISSVTEKAGHGETLDLGVIDEAFAQTDDRLEQAFKPAMVTRSQPQLWINSTAGTADSFYLNSKVDLGRSICDRQDTIAYFEWSADPNDDPASVDTWRSCMPALGHTVSLEAITADRMSMKPADFRRAYLNLRYERTIEEPVIDSDTWDACVDERSSVVDPVAFAVDVAPDRRSASIAVAGARADGLMHVEVIDNRPGVHWVVDRMIELDRRWSPSSVTIDPGSAAGALVNDLIAKGIQPQLVTARQMAQACGQFYDATVNGVLRHRGQLNLDTAVAGARRRPLGELWTWSRKDVAIDLSCLVASTLAVWAYTHDRSTAVSIIEPAVIDPWSIDE